MPKTLTVNNIPYAYPVSGDEPGWGGDATGWAEGVTNVLSDLLGPNDILETAFNIANGQGPAAADITGLVFNSASVRAAQINYSIYRQTTTTSADETGVIQIKYNNFTGAWSIQQFNILGSGGVNFSITAGGQVQYTSTLLGGTGVTSILKFRAKTLQQ